MVFEKISHCEPLLCLWEGREDPAILPLADGIFHLFVTLMAVLLKELCSRTPEMSGECWVGPCESFFSSDAF